MQLRLSEEGKLRLSIWFATAALMLSLASFIFFDAIIIGCAATLISGLLYAYAAAVMHREG